MAELKVTQIRTSDGTVYDVRDEEAQQELPLKAEKNNAVFTGSVSMGRSSGSTVGMNSVAVGTSVGASGSSAIAEGHGTSASGNASHAGGIDTIASGAGSYAEGYRTRATGEASHAEGRYTVANHLNQHVFGDDNVEDTHVNPANMRGTYVEIVGNGFNTETGMVQKSNARTLDWSGNERLKGDIYVNCTADSKNGTPLGASYNSLKGRKINGSTLGNGDITIGTPVNVSGNNYKFVMQGGVSNG